MNMDLKKINGTLWIVVLIMFLMYISIVFIPDYILTDNIKDPEYNCDYKESRYIKNDTVYIVIEHTHTIIEHD